MYKNINNHSNLNLINLVYQLCFSFKNFFNNDMLSSNNIIEITLSLIYKEKNKSLI